MEENDGNMVRFRLVFDDRHLLHKSLRSQGLRRCWFLLKPGITTVGDLASHIRKCFSLHDRIVLLMDDFVLPSFESTSIITDKDIITVKKKEVKQKDICKPCDGRNLIKDSQIDSVHDLPFSNVLLPDDNSQKNSHGSGSSDKEKLFSCMETAVLDQPSDVGLAKRKRKKSKKLLGSKSSSSEQEVKPLDNPQSMEAHQLSKAEKESGQSEENNSDHEFELNNSPDVRKIDIHKKQASSQLLHHNSDMEDDVAHFEVQPGYIRIQPQGHGTPEVDETQSLLFVGSSSMNGPNTNKENNFSQTTDNERCFMTDEVPVGDGLLPLPFPKVMSSTNNIIRPKQPVHFKSLLPLRRLPVKDDILVYRCTEQSSSAYPELSSLQVGKVSSFDYNSLKITLRTVLDYEILLENPNGATVQQNASRIKSVESIEIDYSSLLDVRLLKIHGSEEADCQNGSTMKDSWEEALAKGNGNELNISPPEQSNGWSQWVPNKSTNATSRSSKQPNAPVAGVGRGNGRTCWAPKRGMNTCTTNRNMTNRKFNRNDATNRNPNGFSANGNVQALPWSYRATGLPAPWDLPYQHVFFPPGGKYSASGNQ